MKKLINFVKNYVFLFYSILIVNLWANSLAQASFKPDQVFKSGRFDVSIFSQYYKTTANFDANKNKQTLLASNYYQIFDFNPQVRWAVTHDWGLRAGFNVGTAESSDLTATRRNSTFNRLDLGVDYLLFEFSNLQALIDLEYSHGMDKIQSNTDSVLNSDGVSELKPTAIVRLSLDGFYPYSYLGFNFRSEGLSTLMTYGVGAEYRFSEVGIGAALNAYSSIKDDDKTNSSLVRDSITTRVSAGSKKFYSINPNLINSELFFNFEATDNLLIKLFGQYDIYGSNISQGFAIGATVQFAFDTGIDVIKSKVENKLNSPNGRRKIEPAPTNSNHFFQEDTDDGVNQDYFKPIDPKKEDYIQPLDESDQSSHKTLKNPDTTDSSVQKDLDQLGYSIKLKKKKKK